MPSNPAPRAWLGRYGDPLPVRSRGSFHVVSAARVEDGRRCAVVVPGAGADPRRVEKALAEVERVHALFEHPRVPRVTARGAVGEVPYLELGCDVAADGSHVLGLLADSEQKIPYEAADGFVAGVRLALEAAHAAIDPLTGGPVCLGRISYANLLFGPDGRWWLTGFGCNFPVERDTGAPGGWDASFHAPEMAAGGSASPMGDYVALVLLMRSLLPYADTKGPLERLLRGDLAPGDAEIFEHLRWFDQHVVTQAPARRPRLSEAVVVSDRIRALLGVTIDYARFDGFVGDLLARQDEPQRLDDAEPPGALSVVIGPDASWVIAPDGERHRLGRPQRRILEALVERRREGRSATLSMWELLEVGWPGERPILEAGANRVYVTLTRLRRLGLRDVIERIEDGYRIAPQVTVRLAG